MTKSRRSQAGVWLCQAGMKERSGCQREESDGDGGGVRLSEESVRWQSWRSLVDRQGASVGKLKKSFFQKEE